MSDQATAVESIVLTVSPQPVDVMPVAEEADVTVVANDLAVAATDAAAELDTAAQEVAADTAVAEADSTAAVMVATSAAIEAQPVTELPVADINLAATVLPEPPAAVVDTTSVQTVIETVAPTGDATIIITPEAVAADVIPSDIPAAEDIEAVNAAAAGVSEATEAITGETLYIDDRNFKKEVHNQLIVLCI